MTGLRFSIREILLVTLIVALLVGWGAQTYLRKWPTARERSLMEQRLEALREIVNMRKALMEQGIGGSDHAKAYRNAQGEALAAELELCESQGDRIKVLQRFVDATQQYEKLSAQRYKVGADTHDEMLSAKAERLKAEIALERAKAGR
jgi:hypothetical protein